MKTDMGIDLGGYSRFGAFGRWERKTSHRAQKNLKIQTKTLFSVDRDFIRPDERVVSCRKHSQIDANSLDMFEARSSDFLYIFSSLFAIWAIRLLHVG